MLLLQTAGESHGPVMTGILSGFPSGIPLDSDLIESNLNRRRGGSGRSDRMTLESDRAVFTGGILNGRSTGSPVCFTVENRVKDGGRPGSPDAPFIPRPGPADMPGVLKHGFDEVTPVSERASARSTVISVVAGSLAAMLLRELGVEIFAWVTGIGPVGWENDPGADPGPRTTVELTAAAAGSPVYCPDPDTSAEMVRRIKKAAAAGDTLGGSFEVTVNGLVPGIGGYENPETRLDGRLAGALMAIPSARGVFIGDPLVSCMRGTEAAGGIVREEGRLVRTGAASGGGIEGGMTTGEPVSIQVSLKPVPTVKAPVSSVDLRGKAPAASPRYRADTCIVPAASVIGEALVALVFAAAVLERFGGAAMADIRTAYLHYKNRIGWEV